MQKKALLLLPVAMILMGAGCSQVAVPPQVPPATVPPVNVTPTPIVTPPPTNALEIPQPTNGAPSNANVAPVPVPPPATVKTFDISAVEFAYSPKSIIVSAGDKVKINFKNNGAYPHNVTIRELGVATKTLQSGESDSLTFSAPASATTLNFYCSVDGHEALGLKGTIIVK